MSSLLRLVKILFAGESGVGKTVLTQHLVEKKFDGTEYPQPTIGLEIKHMDCVIDDGENTKVKVRIVDVAGQTKYAAVASSYFRNVDAILYMYDVTNRESFMLIKERWLPESERYCYPYPVPCVLVGNKVDMVIGNETKRQVSEEEGRALARKMGSAVFEEISGEHYKYEDIFKPVYHLILKVVEDQKTHPEKYSPPIRVDLQGNALRNKNNKKTPAAASGTCCSS
jgi:small GTP-binding protein